MNLNEKSLFNKGVFMMPKKQLVDLVNRLKNSGIQIGFTKPKANILNILQPAQKLSSSPN